VDFSNLYIDNTKVEHGCCWNTAICQKVEKGKGNYGEDWRLVAECNSETAEFIIKAINQMHNGAAKSVNIMAQKSTKKTIKKSPKKKMYWEFHVIKWDTERKKILEKHTMVVQRQSQYNAVTVVRKKYPMAKGYIEELNDKWLK